MLKLLSPEGFVSQAAINITNDNKAPKTEPVLTAFVALPSISGFKEVVTSEAKKAPNAIPIGISGFIFSDVSS